MSALAQPELDGGFSGLRLVAPLADERKLPENRAELANWLVGVAVDVNAAINGLYRCKTLQSGTDNEGDWIALPTNQREDASKSVRWYRALKTSEAVMRVMDIKTSLPDSTLIIPKIQSQKDIDRILEIDTRKTSSMSRSGINARYSEYKHTWLPNANLATFMLQRSEIPEELLEVLPASFSVHTDLSAIPRLLERLDTTSRSINPFLKSGEVPNARGVLPVAAYAEVVETHVARIAALCIEHGTKTSQALVNRFNVV